MWKLKEPVKIILKRHGVVVTPESLAKNQALADLILNDASYFASYGHNLVNDNGTPVKKKEDPGIEIKVNVKKKAEVESQSQTSKPTASTSIPQKTDGMSLNLNAVKQESKSEDSKGKPGRKKGSSVVRQ